MGSEFDPWSGSWDPTCLEAKRPKHKQWKQWCSKFRKDFKNGPHQNKSLKNKKEVIVNGKMLNKVAEICSNIIKMLGVNVNGFKTPIKIDPGF